MREVRYWSTSNARGLRRFYMCFESVLIGLNRFVRGIGYERLEKPVAFIEKIIKRFLFDCQMCGNCILSSTGMSCSMNCPKEIRNGPCGGVRLNGNCEVNPGMRCVWVEAYRGSLKINDLEPIKIVQPPVDRSKKGYSSWVKVMRDNNKDG